MTEQSVPKTTRLQRGIRLHREHGAEITRTTANVYRVPSCSGRESYLVHLDLGCCSCPDYQGRRENGDKSPCKHIVAARIVRAKRRAARRRAA